MPLVTQTPSQLAEAADFDADDDIVLGRGEGPALRGKVSALKDWLDANSDGTAMLGLYALAFGATLAYGTYADYAATPPVGPTDGDRVAIFNDPNPANNIFEKRIAGAWVAQGPVANIVHITERGTPDLVNAPNVHTWNVRWNSGFPSDGSYGGLVVNIDADGTTNFNQNTHLLKVSMDGERRFEVNNFLGQTDIRIGSDEDTFVAFGHTGSGTVSISSGLNAGSGLPEKLLTMSWAATPGESVEVNFQGTNRVHLHSAGAFVHSAQNGRYEWEGYGADRLGFVGYEIASSIGKTFDFNNSGQTAYPGQIVSISTTQPGQKLLQFNSLAGSTYTELGYFSGLGDLNLPTGVFVGRAGTTTLLVKGGAAGTGTTAQFTDSAGNANVTITDDGRLLVGTTLTTFRNHFVSTASQTLVAQRDSSSTSLLASVVSGGAFRNADKTNGNYSSLQFLGLTDTDVGITFGHFACVMTDHTNGSIDSDFAVIARNNNAFQEVVRFKGNGNVGIGTSDQFGGGVKVLALANAVTVPTTNPTNALIFYSETGAGKVRTSAGNVVTFAPSAVTAVTGSRAGNAALASLITAFAAYGFVTDTTTA